MQCGLPFCLSCATRCGSVHPASPLSVCQRCSVGQCARLGFAPRRCWGVTSPVLRKCQSVRWSADMEGLGSLAHRLEGPSLRSALQPVPPLLAHPRYGHPLRFYITPHFRKCRAVVALKLHLVPHTAARPDGFPKQALCKVAFAGDGRTGVGAPRSRVHALRAAVCAPLWCPCTVALVRRCALRFGQWPTASHVVSAPPALGLAAARHWPARSARPPPRGSLSRAPSRAFHESAPSQARRHPPAWRVAALPISE